MLWLDGRLWQQRTCASQLLPELTDLRKLTSPEAEFLKQLTQNTPNRKCTDGALSHFRWYQLDDERYCLAAWLHHSLIDVRSWTILKSLLAESYNALVAGSPLPTFPQLDSAVLPKEEQSWLADSASQDDAAFWQQYVSGLPSAVMTQRVIGEERKPLNVRYIQRLAAEKRSRMRLSANQQQVKEPVIWLSAVALLMRLLPRVHLMAAQETLPVPDVDPLVLADAARFNRFVAQTASLEDLGWSWLYHDGQLRIGQVKGDHAGIMSDKENRHLLGQRITEVLRSRT
ncbi:hypothetical protein EHW64_17160 [Erwinia psidii]|nr:hypothetical protein [Erwinia psidii]MCX8962795.1 hypothetical protein [Erwinia psidii]